ncbi:hypothetical protein J7E93_05420 [Streptomyces sp. ISL-36]|uniref:hypothetical protein n=1 Tax=Streptomyces sp. ISL-36 TaxID=2819182 RepID=UPI001BE8266F|nr:hypothetical protein [Streptomyces sp. ISL-36]MBT2439572.1 hypothetical protein [Streptomyces sp. ISL-36]
MTHGTGPERGPGHSDAVLLAAGAADWALDGLTTAARGLRSLLGRADLGGLAEDGRQDLRARGRLALDRLALGRPAASSPAYLEVLARHTVARQAAARRADGGDRDDG